MTPIEAIAKRVHPALRHKITPDASLRGDLDLCHLDLIGVAMDLEEAHGFMFDGDPETGWETVGDVERAFGDAVSQRECA